MKVKITMWLVFAFIGLAGYIKIIIDYGFAHFLFCVFCFACVYGSNKIQKEIFCKYKGEKDE